MFRHLCYGIYGTLKIFQPSEAEAAAAAAANGVVYVWGQKSFIGSYAWMLASLACRCLSSLRLSVHTCCLHSSRPHWTEWKIVAAANYHKNDGTAFEVSEWLGIFVTHSKTLLWSSPWNQEHWQGYSTLSRTAHGYSLLLFAMQKNFTWLKAKTT